MKTIFRFLIIALIATASVQCTTGFDEYNTNHNEPEYGDISPINMLQALISHVV